MYTNADTVTNKWNELLTNIEEEKPDIVALVEVKPQISRYQLSNAEISM